jgi:hypothetical protein
MRRRMSLLLTSTITFVGLVAGVTPAQAAPNARPDHIGDAYTLPLFGGEDLPLYAQVACQRVGSPVHSAINLSDSVTIRFFRSQNLAGDCRDQIAVLWPRESDLGNGTPLGTSGAAYYATTV